MEPGLELLLRTMQEGFRGVNSRLDDMRETVSQHGERIARLEAMKAQHRVSRPQQGVDAKKFITGLAGLTGIVLVLYEIGQAVIDLIAKIRG